MIKLGKIRSTTSDFNAKLDFFDLFQNIKKSLLCFGLFNKAQSFAPEVDSTLTTRPLEHQLRFSWNNNFFFCYDEVGSDQMDKLGLVVDQGEGLVLKAGRGNIHLSVQMFTDGHKV